MKEKVVSLTALFFRNTLSFMRICTYERALHEVEENILKEIENEFDKIERIYKNKEKEFSESYKNKKTETYAPFNKWIKFKESKWGYGCLENLRELRMNLEKSNLPISENFISGVRQYRSEEWISKIDRLSYKFSKGYFQDYRNYKKYIKLPLDKMKLITEGFIVLFFEKHQIYYNEYINWLKDIDNFFCLKEDKEVKFSYTMEEYCTLEDCVKSYTNLGEKFDRNSFIAFMQEVFKLLEIISGSRRKNDSVLKKEEILDSVIRDDIIKFYHELFNFPEGTIGIVNEDMNHIFWKAASDAIESYYFLKEKKGFSWEECKKRKGFLAFMRYRLYYHLSNQKNNQFIVHCVNAMINDTKEQCDIYINKDAKINNRVWLDGICQIDACRIEEGCQIKNCHIENNVVLHPRVKAENVVIGNGSMIGPDIDIKGEKNIVLNKNKIIGNAKLL